MLRPRPSNFATLLDWPGVRDAEKGYAGREKDRNEKGYEKERKAQEKAKEDAEQKEDAQKDKEVSEEDGNECRAGERLE